MEIQAIKKYMKENKITYDELAERSKLSISTIKKIFSGISQYPRIVCQQYVRPDIVDIWMGDSPDRLVGKVYTHFPDDFMKEQMNAVVFTV